MGNPEDLNQKEMSQDTEETKQEDIVAESEETKEAGIEAEIKEAQTELQEGLGELNGHLDELEELQSDESLSEKAQNILKAGLKEIKDYVTANPTINFIAALHMSGGIGTSLRESKDAKELVSNLLGQALGWGIAKAVAYVVWGRRMQQEKSAKAERDMEGQEVNSAEDDELEKIQPVEIIGEKSPAEEDTESQIKELKEELEEKYNR